MGLQHKLQISLEKSLLDKHLSVVEQFYALQFFQIFSKIAENDFRPIFEKLLGHFEIFPFQKTANS